MRRNHTIGFDAKHANADNTSRGKYARFVIDAMAEACPRHCYFRMYTPGSKENPEYAELARRHNIESMQPDGGIWRILNKAWRYWRVTHDAEQGNVELYHGLNEKLPIGLARKNIRSVVTIHDLGFMHLKSYNQLERLWHILSLLPALHLSDRIIAVSEHIKRDLVRFMNVDPDKIDVIYHGCHSRFRNEIDQQQIMDVAERYKLPEKYILTVGTQRERKNLGHIIESMPNIDPTIHLVVVGRTTAYLERIMLRAESLGIRDRIYTLNHVDDNDMPAIYRGAKLLLMPSRYEGFSATIVEALTVGTPVIAAKGSSLEEAGGPNSIYIKPNDRSELIEAVERVVNDEELRQRMIARGRDFASRFRPEVIAYNIINCYERIGQEIKE